MDHPPPEDFNNEFWKDVPDEVLEALYKDLEAPDGMTISASDASTWATLRASGSFLGNSGSLPQAVGADGSHHSIPPLFLTRSFTTNVTDLKAESPASTTSSFAFPRMPVQVRPEILEARAKIEQLTQLDLQQDTQLDKMRVMQQQLLQVPQRDGVAQIQDQQAKLQQQLEIELKDLARLMQEVVLDPPELHATRQLISRLQIQQQKVELYRRELQQLSSPSTSQCFAMLAIVDQPIPQVIFKGKNIEDQYAVSLVLGSGQEIQLASKIKAALVSEERNWKPNHTPLENDEASMDSFSYIATFHNLKVNVSTRMSMVYLKFQARVHVASSTQATVESSCSTPIIVITNESQWCEAKGKLILMDCFGSQLEIPWPQFANGIHSHFLKATRQNPAAPSRCISYQEFDYLHQKFFDSQALVTQPQVGRFWYWFGNVVQTLRFKRHISTLWFQGLIYGLITKEDTNQFLHGQEEGTFLIRFSETFPGLFAVSYVSDDDSDPVKHYLVKPEDTGSQKTLPDFLREKQQFKFLYQLDTASGVMCKYAKDMVLSPYYSKSKKVQQQGQNGYVLL